MCEGFCFSIREPPEARESIIVESAISISGCLSIYVTFCSMSSRRKANPTRLIPGSETTLDTMINHLEQGDRTILLEEVSHAVK